MGPYKRTLIAALDAYPGGAGVHKGARVDQNDLVYPSLSAAAIPAKYIFDFKGMPPF